MADNFDLDAGLFMRVRRAVGTEETRYYLTGVLIEPIDGGGAWIVATDGVVMMVARDRSAKAPSRILVNLIMPEAPPPSLDQCDECDCALIPRSFDDRRLNFDATPGNASVAGFKSGGSPWLLGVADVLDCADKFPDWRRAWVSKRVAECRSDHIGYDLDPRLLLKICGDDHAVVTGLGDGMASTVSLVGHPDIAGLIMPRSFSAQDNSGADLIAELTKKEKTDA